jgi:Na+-driven multidrug efflux pump
MFANSALIGFGQGFQPVCGINYGAGKMKRVREAYFFCVKYASVFLLVVSVMGFAGAEWIVSIFRKDAQVIEVGTQALRLQLLTFPLGAWIVMCNMMLQSVGRSVRASVVAAGRQGLFFLPLIVILPRAIGLLGVEACQAVADVCTLLLSVPLGLGVLNEMKKDRIDDRQVA